MSTRYYTDFRPTFSEPDSWSLPHVLRWRAKTHGDEVYLDVPHQGLRYTYRETLAAAERIACGLLGDGHEGDRVLLMMGNSAEYIVSWFGAALAGMVEVPINTAYKGAFLEHQVRTTQPRVALVDAEFVDRFLTGDVDAYSSIVCFYVRGDASMTTDAIQRLESSGRAGRPIEVLSSPDPVVLPVVHARDLGSILFTSGTTGLSKGVMMSHSQMVFFADQCVSLTRLTDDDTYMSVGPLFHGNAQFLAAIPAMLVGATFVLIEKYSATQWVDQIRNSNATVTNFVGVMMDWTWKQPPRDDDADNRLRCVFSAPTASSILDAFKLRFGIEAFVEVFGLTEISAPIMAPYGEDRPPGAAGLLVEEYFDARLVDPDTDREVADGVVGELIIRPKVPWTICSGYFNMPDRTAEAQRNLWFHTGDGLRRDPDGWYFFVDRLKDAIRRRGENISSYELEQVALGHPDVAQVAVVGTPASTEAGEDEVAVFAVAREGAELDLESLRVWCVDRFPSFARPEFVTVVDEIPMTPSGKVRKIALREIVARDESGSVD